METKLLLGDCLEKLKELPDNSVDSIVTDPPYGLGKEPYALAMLQDWLETGHHEVKGKGFMGKEWDAFVPQPLVWRECLRVLKPGGHLLAFAGTRTQDLMCLGLRLAGFEIRDMVAWVYGSGFPKSLDVSKALDKMAGVEREIVGDNPNHRAVSGVGYEGVYAGGNTGAANITAPVTEAAKQWDGWGTALKPALEPITLARKPLEGTVAANVLKWHTGGLNIDACRVGNGGQWQWTKPRGDALKYGESPRMAAADSNGIQGENSKGRFPANLIHDGSDEVVALFPQSNGTGGEFGGSKETRELVGKYGFNPAHIVRRNDKGSAARFFYCAKTSKKDRNDGCDDLDDSFMAASNQAQAQLKRGVTEHQGDSGTNSIKSVKNNHPTVKPTDLMRYLCRLITPQGGVILDPYMGSGSTGKAAMQEGNFNFIGIERDPDYFRIAETRITAAQATLASKPQPQPDLFNHE